MDTPRLNGLQSPNRPIDFFKGFLRNPKEVGSVIPSSRFVIRRVLQCGEVSRSPVVVELGPGTGVLTREILRRMPRDGKLIAVELLPEFCSALRATLRDPRLFIYQGSSVDLEKALTEAGESEADLVVSGVPFSTMGRGEGLRTLQAARRVLAPNGRFVAYQFRSAVRRMAEPVFGPAETRSGFWNIPPMRIYTFRRELTAYVA
jgi:phospholipid N-methyltransferase